MHHSGFTRWWIRMLRSSTMCRWSIWCSCMLCVHFRFAENVLAFATGTQTTPTPGRNTAHSAVTTCPDGLHSPSTFMNETPIVTRSSNIDLTLFRTINDALAIIWQSWEPVQVWGRFSTGHALASCTKWFWAWSILNGTWIHFSSSKFLLISGQG